MNTQGIRRRTVGETRDRAAETGREPRRSGWTGILYCCCEDRTLEGALSLAIVVEAKFVDRCVVDRPRMADVPLLKPLVDNRPETGHIRARSLELREWRDLVVIVVIVIKAEVLLT